jgi:hypothetical protein
MKKETKPTASEEMLSRMELRLTDLEDRLEVAEAEKIVLEETVVDMREQYTQGGMAEEPEAEVLYDPYYSRNPYQIIGEIPPDATFPDGQVLGWKNEKHREERRGWRGWIPLEYGDKYTGKTGELLQKYIIDPPPRLEGSSKMDNNVRRADSILCRLDKKIFDTRQTRRELLSKRNTSSSGSGRTQVLRDGIEVTGSGMRDQKRPAGGYKIGEKQAVGEHHQEFPVKPQEE